VLDQEPSSLVDYSPNSYSKSNGTINDTVPLGVSHFVTVRL
jgi:hypothetical protein